MLQRLHHPPSVAAPRATTSGPLRTLGRWMPTFLGFPAGGLVTSLLVGHVDDLGAAVVGGAVSGAILGLVQALGWRSGRPSRAAWAIATAVGFGGGLAAGAATVDYGTDLGALATQGAITGLAVGAAQAVVLARRVGAIAAAWPALLGALWALGWTITSLVGVDVERQYSVFGSSGAVIVTLATAVLPVMTARPERAGRR